MALPEYSREAALAALGVRIVDETVEGNLGHLFRPKERADLGIDGEIELLSSESDGKRRGTGRLIAVQIKCGHSFFAEEKDDHFVFRGEMKHLDYWLGFSVPVIVVICHPDTRDAYWSEVNPGLVELTETGWKIPIAKTSTLAGSLTTLESVARRNYLRSVIDLAAQRWIHGKHAERVEFCGIFALPRDYRGADHLVTIGEETVQLQFLVARYGRFETERLSDLLDEYPSNAIYGERIVLALIAEHPSAFALSDDFQKLVSSAVPITIYRLLFNRYSCEVGELNDDGLIDDEYYKGEPVWSYGGEEWLASRYLPFYIRDT